jgi:hypothetical protein
MFTDNYSTRNVQVPNLLNGQIRKKLRMPIVAFFPRKHHSLRQKRTLISSSGQARLLLLADSLAALINLFEKDNTKYTIQSYIDNQQLSIMKRFLPQ